MDIHIIDVHAFLHTACNVSTFSDKTQSNFPVGGLHFVMRKVTAELAVGNSVVLTFDSKHGKERINSDYKGNRTKNPKVISQAEYLYDLCMKCGIQCYIGGAEADDYIFNICEQYKKDEYNQVFIHSCDYDLCHNVNEDNVFFRTINRNTLNVDYSNFSQVFSTKQKVLFNTITAYKVFCGDKSDNMKPFTAEDNTKGSKIYADYVDNIISLNKVIPSYITRSRELLEMFIKNTNFSDKDRGTLKKRMDIFYPKNLQHRYPDGFSVSKKSDVNLALLAKHLLCIRDYTSLGNLKIGANNDDIVDLTDNLYELGKRFKSGEYSADKNLSFNTSNYFNKSEALNIKDL